MADIKTLRDWIAIATKDFVSAKKLTAPPEPQWETAVYHCQQAVEKALKAVLILHEESPPKTHDIGLLLGKISKFSSEFADLEIVAELFTDYATKYRYQNFNDDPLVEDAVKKAIVNTEKFLNRATTLVEAYADSIEKSADICSKCNQVPCVCGGTKSETRNSRPRPQ